MSVVDIFKLLFFAWIAINIFFMIVAVIIYHKNNKEEPEENTEDVQAFIDGIENAIDNGWDFPEEDFEEHNRLTEGDKNESNNKCNRF